MKLIHKFLLLGVGVVVLFSVPTWLFVTGLNEDIAFSEREAEGATYLPAALAVLKQVQKHRGLSALVLNGRSDLAGKLEQTGVDTDDALRTLAAIDTEHVHLGLGTKVETLGRQWQQLDGEQANLSAAENFARHTALVEVLLTFIVDIADASNITYDPSVEGYQLGIALTTRLPLLTEYSGRIRGLGAGLLAKAEAGPDERSRLASLLGLARRQLSGIGESLDKVYRASPSLQAALEMSYRQALSGSEDALALAEREIVAGEQLSYPAEQYFAAATAALDAQLALVDAMTAEFQQILNRHAADLNAKRQMLLGAVLTLFVLVMGVTVIIVRGVLKAMGGEPDYAAQVVRRVAEGDLTVHVETKQNDSTSLLYAIQGMVAKLAEIAGEVNASADNVASGSQQMSAASEQLSQGAAEQAASVEETSSSIEQMSASWPSARRTPPRRSARWPAAAWGWRRRPGNCWRRWCRRSARPPIWCRRSRARRRSSPTAWARSTPR